MQSSFTTAPTLSVRGRSGRFWSQKRQVLLHPECCPTCGAKSVNGLLSALRISKIQCQLPSACSYSKVAVLLKGFLDPLGVHRTLDVLLCSWWRLSRHTRWAGAAVRFGRAVCIATREALRRVAALTHLRRCPQGLLAVGHSWIPFAHVLVVELPQGRQHLHNIICPHQARNQSCRTNEIVIAPSPGR